MTKILPLLTDPKDGPSFHVVAPSLPNFGFSEGASKRGFGIPQYAEAMHKVMLQLGYNKYGKIFSIVVILVSHSHHCSHSGGRLGLGRHPHDGH